MFIARRGCTQRALYPAQLRATALRLYLHRGNFGPFRRRASLLLSCAISVICKQRTRLEAMPKLPIFRLRNSAPLSRPNLRYDVFLSPRITSDLSFHLARYICRFGQVESLFEMDVPTATQSKFIRAAEGTTKLS